MLTVFIVDGDARHIYITTPDKYSQVLVTWSIAPDRVTYQNISLESLMLLNNKAVEYYMLELIK